MSEQNKRAGPVQAQPAFTAETIDAKESAQDVEEQDADSFAGVDPHDDELQDIDDADPTAPAKPAFPEERRNEERGNRGPDEIPGFGQGA